MPTEQPKQAPDPNVFIYGPAGDQLVVRRTEIGALHLEIHSRDDIAPFGLTQGATTELVQWLLGKLQSHITIDTGGNLVITVHTQAGPVSLVLPPEKKIELRDYLSRDGKPVLLLEDGPDPAAARTLQAEAIAIDHKLRDHGHTQGSVLDRVARVCARLADAKHAREDQRLKHRERVSGIHERLKGLDLLNGTLEQRIEELVMRCQVAERDVQQVAAMHKDRIVEIDRLNMLAIQLAAMADVDLVRSYHQNKLSRVALPETDEHRVAAARNVESRKEQLALIEETIRSYGLTEGSAAERVATLASDLKSIRKAGQGLTRVISAIADIFDIELGVDSDLRDLPKDLLQIKADAKFETDQVHELLDKVPGAGDRSMPLPKRLAPVLADDEILRASAEIAGGRMVLLENVTKDRDALREQVNDICSLLSSEGYGWDIDAGETMFTAFTNLLAHAHLGRAMRALEFQLERLRANPCPTMGCGFTPWEVGKAVRHEVLEVAEQPEGSGAAQRETHGVLAAAVHLVKVHGGSVITALTEEEERLRQRLDWRVWHGKSWKEAKRLLAEGKMASRERFTITSDGGSGATLHVEAPRRGPIEWVDAKVESTMPRSKAPDTVPVELEMDPVLRRARVEWFALHDRIEEAVQAGEWHHNKPNAIDDAIDKLAAAILKNEAPQRKAELERRAMARMLVASRRAARAREELLSGVRPAPTSATESLRRDAEAAGRDPLSEEQSEAMRKTMMQAEALHHQRMNGPWRENPGDSEVRELLHRSAAEQHKDGKPVTARGLVDGVGPAILGKPVVLTWGDGVSATAMGFDTEQGAEDYAKASGLKGFEIHTSSFTLRGPSRTHEPEPATADTLNRKWNEHASILADVLGRLTRLEMTGQAPIITLPGVATGTFEKGFGQMIRTSSMASASSEALAAIKESLKSLAELRAEIDKLSAAIEHEEPPPFPAFVELMGHRQVVATVSAERVGGRVMQTLRWSDSTGREWVKHFGGSAIFSITPLRPEDVEMVKSNLASTPAYEYTGLEYSLLRPANMGNEPSSEDYPEEGLQDEGDDESNETRGGIPF